MSGEVFVLRIEHVALYTNQLEEMKNFYTKYFNGIANKKYRNTKKGFESYFIFFESGSRLELMHQKGICDAKTECDNLGIGFIHVAFSVGSKEKVDELTATLENAGYLKASEPRTTGDGYYESAIFDPDGNLVEITV